MLGLLSIYSNIFIKNDSVKQKFQFKLDLGESKKLNFLLFKGKQSEYITVFPQ